ncbi:MAG: fibrobacter succinogenes major paralogous domain-containing protein, partial [Bacteroidales bacterium]|nr:fibrobacter succinogenes major paralogous domain-containing protein [Bacteroidales bacterium]
MKKNLLCTIVLLACLSFISAQPPQKMTYQTVVRDANNELVVNQPVGVRVSVLKDSANGVAVYIESHTVTTNANALATITVGTGTPLIFTSFKDLDWAHNNYFLKTEIDLAGGTNYTITGVQEFLSVPYAFYSENAKHVDTALFAFTSDTSLYSYSANNANSATYATSAGSAATATTATSALFADSASVADFAHNANNANSATYATSAGSAATATTATSALFADSASVADFAHNANNANSATYATSAGSAATATTATSALFADTTRIANASITSNTANYADSSDFNHLANKPMGVNKGDLLYWETNDNTWHILQIGNVGEVLTVGNNIPQWSTISGGGGSQLTLPAVTLGAITGLTGTSAIGTWTVTNGGGTNFVISGLCWDTLPNPTLANNFTSDGLGLYTFNTILPNLQSGTTYYVRAYAANNDTITYGTVVNFTTLNYATVTTDAASNIRDNSAISGGNVTSDGGTAVTAYGVCWNLTGTPTLADYHTIDGSGTGVFTSSLTNLLAGTTYHVRAYATNSAGTAYGNEIIFTADNFKCGITTVEDYDHNKYKTVEMGAQCWLKENIKSEHYADGTQIALGTSTSSTIAYRYAPNGANGNVTDYGYLYNWTAATRGISSSSNPSGVQGVCPNGWHVPSFLEWGQMLDYVSSQSYYVCSSTATAIAKALASIDFWNTSNSGSNSCSVVYSNSTQSNNSTCFTAIPAGYYTASYSNFQSG